MTNISKICLTSLLSLASLLGSANFASAATASQPNFPHTANYYLGPTPITTQDISQLASYDLVILPVESQITDRPLMKELRRRNPSIKLLAYVSTQSFNFEYWSDSLHQRLLAGIQPDWWLTDSSGQAVSSWPGTKSISVISAWHDYFPYHLAKYVYATGLWDGIFLDEFSTSISWLNQGDIDSQNDGIADDPEVLDAAWRHGAIRLLSQLRAQLGSKAIILVNGVSDDEVAQYVNGRMFEDFPTPWIEDGTWADSMRLYLNNPTSSPDRQMNILNLTTHDTGNRDPQRERLGLTSALLGNGYFSVDYGISDHGQLWKVADSEKLRLGLPSGDPINLLNPTNPAINNSIWRRHFTHGTVIVNATDQAQTVQFTTQLKLSLGVATSTNISPNLSSTWTIPAHDGAIFNQP